MAKKLIRPLYKFALAFVLAQFFNAHALGQTMLKEETDWATMVFPAEAETGQEIDFVLTPKLAADEGNQLAVDLYWMKANGDFGGLLSYGLRKPAVAGESRTFRLKVSPKPGMGGVQATAFLSPDGEWDSRLKVLRGPVLPVTASESTDGEQKQVVESTDWAKLEYPATVKPGEIIKVAVTLLKPPPPGAKLAADLYWMKADGGFGGLLSYGQRQDAVSGAPQTFHLTVRATPEMATVQVTAFLSPDGEWGSRQEVIRGPSVPILQAQGEKSVSPTELGVDFKKSWISIQAPSGPYREGDEFTVKVEYYLDPSESWGAGTELYLAALGPWIDNPDGHYTKSRTHIDIPGLTGYKTVKVQPGRHSQEFHYKVPQLYPFNDLLLLAGFKMDGGKANWPWHVRASGPTLQKTHAYYDLATDRPGNLFIYDEPVKLQIISRQGAEPGKQQRLSYQLTDTNGQTVNGELDFKSANVGKAATLQLPVPARGTFVLTTQVEGWGKREMVLARIPDVQKAAAGEPTRFGVTNVRSKAENEIARRLGFSWVRHFFPWSEVRPGRDQWNLDAWDRILQENHDAGLTPWLCLVYPPAWVQTGKAQNVPYVPYGFDSEGLISTVQELSQRWGDLIWGWEWQNEIVPGDLVDDPVANYLDFVRTGTEALRAVKPDLKTQMAGGLWPRNFRNDLLRQGIAQYIDVLPVHYGNYDAVQGAQADLSAVGAGGQVQVWDNETSRGLSVWKTPLTEMIQDRTQSQWLLERWTGELSAGAEQITLFGGQADPAGNWSYLLDAATVRPYATTAAVFISKLAGARPLGVFYLASGAEAHLFDRAREVVLVLSSPTVEGEHSLPIGATQAIVTDYQGREELLRTKNGMLSVRLGPMPIFVEGGSLPILQANTVAQISAGDRPQALPQLSAVTQGGLSVPLHLHNPYDRQLNLKVQLWPEGAQRPAAEHSLSLAAGEKRMVELPVDAAKSVGRESWRAVIQFPDTTLPVVVKPFLVSWIDPRSLGNLIADSGFDGSSSNKSAWSIDSKSGAVPSDGSLGTGEKWLELSANEEGWLSASQEIDVPSGRSFLFTMWAHPKDLQQGGANITYILPEGKTKTLYIPHVFQTPSNADSWLLLSYHGEAPEDVLKIQFSPVANPAKTGGAMLVDQVRVTRYEGTQFAAEAARAQTSPTIDGRLDDWKLEAPIPLLAVNQLITHLPGYEWTPKNLSGVAYFTWDEEALYLAAEVIDDIQAHPHSGDRANESDSIMLGLQPTPLGKDTNQQAFAYYLSAASPGGGSGKYTLYRPENYSGGLASGHLAKDSSAYEIVIHQEADRTIYEAKLPWVEMGVANPHVGKRLGLSLSLADNDGQERQAQMLWGQGLSPVWEPSQFGQLTLIGPSTNQ